MQEFGLLRQASEAKELRKLEKLERLKGLSTNLRVTASEPPPSGLNWIGLVSLQSRRQRTRGCRQDNLLSISLEKERSQPTRLMHPPACPPALPSLSSASRSFTSTRTCPFVAKPRHPPDHAQAKLTMRNRQHRLGKTRGQWGCSPRCRSKASRETGRSSARRSCPGP